jgi:hypothetical protein
VTCQYIHTMCDDQIRVIPVPCLRYLPFLCVGNIQNSLYLLFQNIQLIIVNYSYPSLLKNIRSYSSFPNSTSYCHYYSHFGWLIPRVHVYERISATIVHFTHTHTIFDTLYLVMLTQATVLPKLMKLLSFSS